MSEKGRNQNGNLEFSIREAANCLQVSERAVRKNCANGRYKGTKKVSCNGGDGWVIPLSSLPQSAQHAYSMKLAREETARIIEPREQVEARNEQALEMARKAATNGKSLKPHIQPIPINQEEYKALWAAWERSPQKAKQKAKLFMDALILYSNMQLDCVPKFEISRAIQKNFGISPATLWRKLKAVEGQSKDVWVPLLIPRWKGKAGEAEFTPEAWEYIKQEWGSQSKPSISRVLRDALKLVLERNWIIPSQDTVERRIRDLPPWWAVLRREGEKELKRLYPAQQRDYSTLKLHEMWCSDGRKADVFVRFEDGTVARPIVVAWMELRSRVCLGYAVGKTESADLIRIAFKNAAEESKAIPTAALMDNGRGFASKLLTGGTPNRYRFKVKDEDIPGILTMLGVEVCWATPGHGQAKPIESWWRTVAQMDKRGEFRGAYCGNKPDARPEEFDPKTVVPIETYLQLLQEEINAYHQRPHRGDSMDGQSPSQMYDTLLANTVVRQPTAEQLRLCLLAAENIRLTPEHQIKVLDNRYWTEQLAALSRDHAYVVRFDPEDASKPVALYEGERFICDVPIIERAGFRNQQAAKDHARERNKFIRGKKEQDKASRGMHSAMEWHPRPEPMKPELPAPKLASLVRPVSGNKNGRDEEDDLDLSPDKVMEILTRQALKKKAAGGD